MAERSESFLHSEDPDVGERAGAEVSALEFERANGPAHVVQQVHAAVEPEVQQKRSNRLVEAHPFVVLLVQPAPRFVDFLVTELRDLRH